MENINRLQKEKCTGCSACAECCPTRSIQMLYDDEGFLYPFVNTTCVNCGKCAQICPVLSDVAAKGSYPENGYISVARDQQISFLSASGGGFVVFASWIIEKMNGVVFGCVMDSDFQVFHCSTEAIEGLSEMQGSKYVQSDVKKTYTEARNFLESGRYVLYTGTPCQIAGLKCYLEKPYPNLFTVDIICHGVPSPIVFTRYINWLGCQYHRKIKSYRFRNKTIYGGSYIIKIVFQDGKILYKNPMKDIYYRSFLDGLSFRTSCYNCPFSQPNRISDITTGDCSTRSLYSKFLPFPAVSSIIVNNFNGETLWAAVLDQFDSMEIDLEQEIKKNRQLNRPCEYQKACKRRLEMLNSSQFQEIAREISKNDSFLMKIYFSICVSIPQIYRKRIIFYLKKFTSRWPSIINLIDKKTGSKKEISEFVKK